MNITFEEEFPEGPSGSREKLLPEIDIKYVVRITMDDDLEDDLVYDCANIEELDKFLERFGKPESGTVVIYTMSEIYSCDGLMYRVAVT